ncbi:TauD/TfdA family dioxygenase [Shimia sediminis]|uniref:TauD/TfdA family dioxygenase n=1 Tax=Shimia sediminis TaxID=2497945 RepID=UPI00198189C0|nr:TauD/TfdA family dioxygenase [Shimia sediminis]
MSILRHIPETLSGPSVWTGREMQARQKDWLIQLSDMDIADLESAARQYLSLGQDIGDITKGTFPLTHFAGHVAKMREKLIHGIGFEVLRGLPIASYTQEMAATIFCGIGAHLGSARSQNAAGHILGHVRDVGADAKDPTTRIYQTHERQTFHTDSADIVALLCLQDAQQGGDSLLVSAEALYNRMRAEHPDLLERLFDPIATDRRGEVPEGMQPFMTIPPLNWHAGKLIVFYQRQYIDSAQRFPEAMRLSDAHVQALDMFDAVANDPDMHLTMRLEPGDMQFVYNHAQLHDRTGFIDRRPPEKPRHLLRLWLSPEGDRPLPECFKQRYGSIEIGDRGGILTKGTRLHAPLD